VYLKPDSSPEARSTNLFYMTPGVIWMRADWRIVASVQEMEVLSIFMLFPKQGMPLGMRRRFLRWMWLFRFAVSTAAVSA
jgi:hypothetical protein